MRTSPVRARRGATISTDVRILTEGLGFRWSPNGDYLLFASGADGEDAQPGIFQIPRGGGEIINLSDLTQPGAYDLLGGWCR